MTNTRLHTRIGALTLKNPVICGAGEHTMTADAIRAALRQGAGAVVAKSTNESQAAKDQLDRTDYALFDARWQPVDWHCAAADNATLFCRSGLVQRDFDGWLDELAQLDREAAAIGSFVIPSLILADLERCSEHARRIEQTGLRVLEVNIGAPHGDEAAQGAIRLERDAERIRRIVTTLRAATRLPLWIKLTGQSEDVAGLADAARSGGADAVILMGRFMGFLPDLETQAPVLSTNAAIGGGWALPLTARWIAISRRRLGPDTPLIATNGARNGLDVARFLLAGAAATEMTSAVFTHGYAVLGDAIAELDAYLETRGQTVTDALGLAADRIERYQQQTSRPGYWENFVPRTN
ncbi:MULTISPECIES: dihydroorotate dehydrogenase [unclassified Burkholderia]|uniref:dihydroorotate dehydrogenase n=1 Tax=unclassified Burkholderia TaxID=2613784 RepID=UPI000F56F57E|nr:MULTISPECIES: dihydroorotate dehydrogenase [unclassified Burkholderia]RQS26447.1 dihydroorotate dehydrogenase [Burkholderia sp. Bp8995]RQS48425.1 dihydroorotate dehydrogenase [Burkholderia sp. Bp8989]